MAIIVSGVKRIGIPSHKEGVGPHLQAVGQLLPGQSLATVRLEELASAGRCKSAAQTGWALWKRGCRPGWTSRVCRS
jgi:hypothetical protein